MPPSRAANSTLAASVARWMLPSVAGLSLVFVVVFMFAMQVRFLADSDAGWHIRTGDLIRRTGQVPRVDPFSFTMAGREWFAWEWSSDWIMSWFHQRFGLSGVVVAFFTVLAAAHALLVQVCRRRAVDTTVALVVLCVSALCSSVHWLARPHLFSILLIVVWSMLVEGYRRGRSGVVWSVPLLIVPWANLHAAFVITIPMLVVYAAGEWLEAVARGAGRAPETRRMLWTYASVAVLSLVAGLATPYGLGLYAHIVGYLGDVSLLGQIDEFQSPNFHDISGRFTELLIGLSVVAAAQAARRGRFVEPLLVAMWVHLMLQSQRHISLAAAVLAPIIAEQWHHLLRELAAATGVDRMADGIGGRLHRLHARVAAIDGQVDNGAVYLGLVLLFLVLFADGNLRNTLVRSGFPDTSHPVAAARFIERERAAGRLQGHLFAPDQFGGYLIYRFEGRLKVFFDGRSDFYSRGPAFADALSIGRVTPEWDTLLDRYDVQWMLLRPETALSVTALASGTWTRVYQDPIAEILVRRGGMTPIIESASTARR